MKRLSINSLRFITMLVALIAPTATMAIPPTTDFMNTLTVCATNFNCLRY